MDVYAGVAQVCGAGVGEVRAHWFRHYYLLRVRAYTIVPSGSVKVRVKLVLKLKLVLVRVIVGDWRQLWEHR